MLRTTGILLHYAAAGLLLFVMSLALTTFLPVSSAALGLLAVSSLTAASLALFALSGRGRGDAAQGLRLAVLAAVAWAAVAGTHAVWHRRVEALKRGLRAAGRPVTLADFQEGLPDDQYANPALEAALMKLASGPGRWHYSLHPGEKIGVWSDATLKAESAAVAPYLPVLTGEVFPILDRRRRLERADFVHEAERPYEVHTPKYVSFLMAGSIMSLDAVARARRGDKEGAWADLRHGADLADLAASGRTLIARMVAVAARRRLAAAAINIALNARLPLPEDLAGRLRRSLSERLVSGGLDAAVARSLDVRDYFERCRWAECEPTDFLSAVRLHPLVGRALGLADVYALAAASQLSFDDPWPDWARLRAGLAARKEPATLFFTVLPLRSSGLYGKLYAQEWDERAWTQLALLSSAVVRFRAKAGRWPRELGELPPGFASPDLLIDPFSGKAFKYSSGPGGGGFELSSAGPEGRGVDSRGRMLMVRS